MPIRVIAGEARGRRLRLPRSPSIRPTADRVKEAVFNSLHLKIPGSRFLDLCAGTGAMGIEALSRGAQWAVFVEMDGRVARVIRENLGVCGLTERAEVILADALRALEGFLSAGREFDLIYVDPPYDSDLAERILRFVDSHPEVVSEGGRIIFEHRSKDIVRGELNRFSEALAKHFGDRGVSFFARREQTT